MMTIEEFADIRRQPSNTLESKMAYAYRKAKEEIESTSKDIWRFIRAKHVDGQLVPYFLLEAESPLLAIDSAEKRLEGIKTDIRKFIKLMNGDSRLGLAEELRRAKWKISAAEFDHRTVWNQALIGNAGMSPIEAEKLEVVQIAAKKKELIKAKYEPIVTELQDKLTKANIILTKYN